MYDANVFMMLMITIIQLFFVSTIWEVLFVVWCSFFSKISIKRILDLKNEATKPTDILEDKRNIQVLYPNFKTLYVTYALQKR